MLDFCGWTNVAPADGQKQVFWVRNQGETKTGMGAGPRVDHTTNSADGWYIYVPLSVQDKGVAVLQSELLTTTGTVCFGFYYNLVEPYNGPDPAPGQYKIRVTYRSPNQTMEVGNCTNVDTEEWLKFEATLNNLPKGQFVIETYQMGSGDLVSYSNVALDDISLKKGACDSAVSTTQTTVGPTTPEPQSEAQWDCDFESITCPKWSIDKGGWTRTSWNMSMYHPVITQRTPSY